MSNIKAIDINGDSYYDIGTFAKIVHRDISYISYLVNRGNKIRCLKHIRIGSKPLILASEVDDFPFISNDKRRLGASRGAGV